MGGSGAVTPSIVNVRADLRTVFIIYGQDISKQILLKEIRMESTLGHVGGAIPQADGRTVFVMKEHKQVVAPLLAGEGIAPGPRSNESVGHARFGYIWSSFLHCLTGTFFLKKLKKIKHLMSTRSPILDL